MTSKTIAEYIDAEAAECIEQRRIMAQKEYDAVMAQAITHAALITKRKEKFTQDDLATMLTDTAQAVLRNYGGW